MKQKLLKLKKILRCLRGKEQLRLNLKQNFTQGQRKDEKIKIITLYYWDTREKFSQSWKYNVPIVEHNFLTWHKNLPQNFFVENHIFLHRVSEIPLVYHLIDNLKQKYKVLLHTFEMDLKNIDHFHKFNFVAEKSYKILGNQVFNFDYIFTIGQDNLLINKFRRKYIY
jgi:hypothetical protein